jgi:signal transduction histidine kinase/ActR/RegA family two-component response regulator
MRRLSRHAAGEGPLNLTTIASLDLEGRVTCRQTPPPSDLRFNDRSYFPEAIETGAFTIGEYTEGRVAGRPVLPLALPLRSLDGRTIGIVAAALDLRWLTDRLAERGLSKNGSITVADRKGIIIARSPFPERFIGMRIPETFQPLISASEAGAVEVMSQDGTLRVLGYVPVSLSPKNIYVSAGLSSDEVYGVIDRTTRRAIVLVVIGLILATGFAWLAGRYIVRQPIAALLAVADAWRRGDYAARTGLSGRGDEIGALGEAFDRMMDEIAWRQAERDRINAALQEREEQLRQLNATLEMRVAAALTEREKSERALLQAQKMQAVGQLAGGIAHDFNNLLTAVQGSLELLERHINSEAGQRLRASALRATLRGGQLAERLLVFSRWQNLMPASTDLKQLLEAVGEMLARTLGGTVTARIVAAGDLWPALADATQVELAILNLAINARDAMPLGGTLTVSAENRHVDPAAAAAISNLSPGDYVVIAVSDTGTGMTEEVLAQALEPFFTTKDVGKGTGLGLSQVYGVATQLGGGINIWSRLGEGTKVEIFLPRSPASASGASGDAPAGPTRGRVADTVAADRTPAAILVVDDDVDVRDIVVGSLRRLGYAVIEAENGIEALGRLDDAAGEPRVGLLVADVAMADMSGMVLAERARMRRPDLPVLYITGYADTSVLALEAGASVLRKPFRIAELADKVAHLLARTEEGGFPDVDTPLAVVPRRS